MKKNDYIEILLSILVALFIGGIVIVIMGYNPFIAYQELFKGAFQGNFGFGSTLAKFTPLLLTALAFHISTTVSVFNVGVEGSLYLGAMAAAWAGFGIQGVPAVIHVPICLLVGALAGGLWALIPAALKAYYNVNEICTTILLNYVAIDITSYMVNFPLSSKSGSPQTPSIADSASLTEFMLPSKANTGLFIALALFAVLYWMLYHTTMGYKLRSTGANPAFSEYVGINPKHEMMKGMFISGALGGVAGAIEVMGVYGCFLDNFSNGIANNGMLVALISRGDIRVIPVMAFFLAILQSGALGMQRYTSIDDSIIDAIIALFILFATMQGLFKLKNSLGEPKKHSRLKMGSEK